MDHQRQWEAGFQMTRLCHCLEEDRWIPVGAISSKEERKQLAIGVSWILEFKDQSHQLAFMGGENVVTEDLFALRWLR